MAWEFERGERVGVSLAGMGGGQYEDPGLCGHLEGQVQGAGYPGTEIPLWFSEMGSRAKVVCLEVS